jgi:uncharacterized protein involved in response to NO
LSATPPLAAAPAWRREPYRLLFPLGALLAWAGIAHWLWFALQWSTQWRPVFHSIAQIQGFMACFMVGFLFTAIPRRTGTAPPAAWEMALGALCPVATTVAAWYERFALSQVFWIALIATVLAFALRRFRAVDAARRPPDSFVWVPIALLFGLVGAVLIGLYGIAKLDFTWHQLGRLLVLQGVFVGLVLGVGGMVLPLITRGEAPPDAEPAARGARRLHLLCAVLLVATFAVEVFASARDGHLARGALTCAILWLGARIARPPSKPGWHRCLVWVSAWMIPAGYFVAAALPGTPQVGLHVVFVAGFALMALAVGLHVTFAHGGREDLVTGRPWQVPVLGALVLMAAASRGMVNLDPERLRLWLGAASACFLAATLLWASLLLAARQSVLTPSSSSTGR